MRPNLANPLPPDLAHLFERSIRECIICGSENVIAFGLFIPKDSREFGAPAGKRRTFAYWTCGCMDPQSTAEEVEKLLLESHGAGKGDA